MRREGAALHKLAFWLASEPRVSEVQTRPGVCGVGRGTSFRGRKQMGGIVAIQRREFLKKAIGQAAVVTGFPTIIPSSALGADGAIAPSERIVLGCIGTGRVQITAKPTRR
jgi:hypothetical protein